MPVFHLSITVLVIVYTPEISDSPTSSSYPPQRLGCLKNGAQDVKDHPWFSTIDWVALLEKRVPPPIVPELRGATDTSQFDCIDSSGHARVVPYVSDGSNWDAGF